MIFSTDQLTRLFTLSSRDPKRGVETALRLTVEVGELGLAVLTLVGTPTCPPEKLNKTIQMEPSQAALYAVLEEIVDVAIVLGDLLYKCRAQYGSPRQGATEFSRLVDAKLDKWEARLVAYESEEQLLGGRKE